MNKVAKSALKKVFTDEKYKDLQNNHRRTIINKNRAKKEKVAKAEEIKKEKIVKKLETKKESNKKAVERRKIKMFHENFREIMEEHNIYVSEDKTVTPYDIELLTAEGAEGVSCNLAFPKGLSPSDLDKTVKSLAQNVYGKCMIFIEDEVGEDTSNVKFSAIKKWHNIKYIPYLKHNGKNLTASQLFCGYNIKGEPIIVDMAKDPHLMITGGSGGGNKIAVLDRDI